MEISEPVSAPNPDRRQLGRRWIILALGWLSLEYWGLGPFSYLEFTDSADSHLPTILATAGMSGGPLWMPNFASGADRLSQGLFPGLESIIFSLLPGWLGAQLYTVGGVLAGGIGIALLGRDVFKLSALAAWIAGLFYATQQAAAFGAIYASVFGFLPLLIWALGRSLKHPSLSVQVGGAVTLSLVLAGLMVPQFLFPFGILFALAWFIFCDPLRTKRGWLVFIGCGLLIGLVRSQELAALLLNASTSHRADWVYLPNMDETLKSIFEELFGSGVRGPMYLWLVQWVVIVSMLASLRRAGGIHLMGLLIFTAALVVGPAVLVVTQTALAEAFAGSKFFNYNFLHFYPFVPIPAALLMGFAINYWNRDRQLINQLAQMRAKQFTVSGVMFGLIILAMLMTSVDAKVRHGLKWMGTGNYVRNMQSPVLQEFAAETSSQKPFRVGFFDLPQGIAGAYGLEVPTGYLNLYPDRYQEFFMAMMAPSFATDPKFAAYVNGWGNRLELFRGPSPETRDLTQTFNLSLLSLSNTRYIISRNKLVAPDLVEVRKAPAPRVSLSTMDRFWRSLKQNFTGYTELYIYENTNVLPRAYIASQVQSFANDDALMTALESASVDQLRTTAFVQSDDQIPAPETMAVSGDVTITNYQADQILMNLDGASSGVLVISNTYSPYWVAEIDGKPAPIFPVHHTYWGVKIAPGDRQVQFRYEPPYRYLPFRF